MYRVDEPTLDNLVEAGFGYRLHPLLASAAFGVVLAFASVLLTGSLEDATANIVIGVTAIAFIMAAIFAALAWRDTKLRQQALRRIKGD